MKLSLVVSTITLLAGLAFSAHATLIGTISHDYGIGKHSPLHTNYNGSCGSLHADHFQVNVTGCSSGSSFHDGFDFSHLAFEDITSFELTLTYNLLPNTAFFGMINNNRWYVRPAVDQINGSLSDITAANRRLNSGNQTMTFTFNNSLDVFDSIVESGSFYLWFSRSGGERSFDLSSATLDVFGTPAQTTTPVPAPATLALLGLGLLGLRLRRR
ncbi:PEP-CTERM sorting domain-containing protein [Alkalimonas collagenimarina]|uniref:PEP-CTERM sorting domain-containing protein n=1 Tax=Alkalimonas collagenimarina TaxID=400390 RepID=A0ABT9GY49_9GAMM|nr:PEP-CTERM sorting domain-containing protein [Alkalimonas collagenimarina]MDP4535980.1 PEP-CTERM sorting domain-containing protein [Alkalimonas collagenimarina]